MPVDSAWAGFDKYKKEWLLMEDCLEGQGAITKRGTTYLPKLSDHQSDNSYKAYKNMGVFLGATAITISGLTGIIMRKPPNIESNIELDQSKPVTLEGLNFIGLCKLCASKLLTYGYLGCLVDIPKGGGEPYVVQYDPSNIINVQVTYIDGKETLTMVVLKETISNPSEDEFETTSQDRYRVLRLVNGIYSVELWVSKDNKSIEWEVVDVTIPSIMGKELDFIPFVFLGSVSNSSQPSKPPLLDLAYLNIKHWQLSTDYYYGLHICALPTPWAAGFEIGQSSEFYIGPSKAWVSEDPAARCGYLEFTGAGMDAVRKGLEGIVRQMALVGSRMLEESKNVGEAAEAVERRQSSDIAALSGVATSLDNGMSQILKFMLIFKNKFDATVKVSVNRDFVSSRLTPQDIQALLSALIQGSLSLDTFLYNLKQGEILPDDKSIDDEKALLTLYGSPFIMGAGATEKDEEIKE